MLRVRNIVLMGVVLLTLTCTLLAQRYRGGGWYRDSAQTAREIPQHGAQTPMWEHEPGFEDDVFTFARVRYSESPFGYGGRGTWDTDLPDSDLNLSYRLQQMTSMKVDPNGRIVNITDPALKNYPFLYIVEPGSFFLTEPEASALREYLLNGGFVWFDDFWGEREWAILAGEMKKVFPNRDFEELSLDHPIYHSVNQITAKHQVPDVRTGTQSQWTGRTSERHDSEVVHHRAIFDDTGRLMAFASHNTDNGDGWEWEGDNLYYFREFSEKTAYPLAINVLYYVMTH